MIPLDECQLHSALRSHRLVIPGLTAEQLKQFAGAQLKLDALTRRYVHYRLEYRFSALRPARRRTTWSDDAGTAPCSESSRCSIRRRKDSSPLARAQLAQGADVPLPRQAVDDRVHAAKGDRPPTPASVGFGLGHEALKVLECQMHPDVISECAWPRHEASRGTPS